MHTHTNTNIRILWNVEYPKKKKWNIIKTN